VQLKKEADMAPLHSPGNMYLIAINFHSF